MTVEPRDVGPEAPGGRQSPADTAADEEDRLIGRAMRRLLALASQDETIRAGLEVMARSVLATVRRDNQVAAGPEPETGPLPHQDGAPVQDVQAMAGGALASLVEQAARGADPEEIGSLAAAFRRAARVLDEATPQLAAHITGGATDGAPAAAGTAALHGAAAAHIIARRNPRENVHARATQLRAQLTGLAERARLKGALVRAVAERAATGSAIDASLLHRARSAGCTTWMVDLVEPEVDGLLALAACFEAVADTAELLHLLLARDQVERGRFVDAVRTLAALQSALRVAVERFRRTADEDQEAAFAWLRETTAEERIFVEHHMRLEDPLDPGQIGEVWGRVKAELGALRGQDGHLEARRDGFGQVRYHAGRLAQGKGSDHDRVKIVEAVSALVEGGLPSSNLELRAMLLPILARLPVPDEGGPEAYARVIANLELQAARARDRGDGSSGPVQASDRKAVSENVQRAAALVRGTELVLVGGERRVDAERSLVQSLKLSGLRWFTLSEDPTLAELERAILRSEVSLVIQLIRWSRHRHGEAQEIAERHGKPFVRVPGGYNPSAISRAILEQASERLGGGR